MPGQCRGNDGEVSYCTVHGMSCIEIICSFWSDQTRNNYFFFSRSKLTPSISITVENHFTVFIVCLRVHRSECVCNKSPPNGGGLHQHGGEPHVPRWKTRGLWVRPPNWELSHGTIHHPGALDIASAET